MATIRHKPEPSDGDLVAMAKAGDLDAFETLVVRHRLPLHYYFLRRQTDHMLADDLVQATFIRVYLQLDQLRDNNAFLSWFYRIAYTILASHARRQKAHHVESLDALLDNNASRHDLSYLPAAIERFPDFDVVNHVLESMSPMLRETFLLRHYAQCPAREVAEILAIPVTTARKRIARANEHVRVWRKTLDTLQEKSA